MKKAVSLIISLIFIATICISSTFYASANTLPSAYNNNYANLQYVTPVRSQGEYGNCWAFAAIACCEAEAVKNHGANRYTTDLSELHLAYFSYNGERNTGDYITAASPFYEHGGYSQLPIFTFSNWIGVVDESVAKYSDFIKNPAMTLDKSLMYNNISYYISNAFTYSLPNDIEKVKEAVYTYGAVQTAYYSGDAYLSSSSMAHYCPSAYNSDHAVTIVGWDDNYPRTNFKSSARPQKNGAWLVKNSWGSDWGTLNGYFWLSYEDKSVTSATVFDVTPADDFSYDNNYQHDGGISLTYSKGYEKNTAANIFTAKGNEELSAISIMTYDKADSDYNLKIYLNPNNLAPNAFNKDKPVHEQSGKIDKAGYTTIPLTSTVTLHKDDVFIICLETTAYIALDADQNISGGNSAIVKSNAKVLKNQTYFAINDGGFYDPYDQDLAFNARIKAFTKNLTLGNMVFHSLPSASSIEYGQTLKSSTLSGGVVVDSLSNKEIRGEWSFKNPDLIPKNGDSVKIIFTPVNSSYGTIEKSLTVTVTESTPKLTLTTDKQSYKGGDTVKVSAGVQNEHSKTLTDLPTMKFYYQIDDGEKTFFTGSFILPKDLSGKKITIGVITDAIEDKYEEAQKTVSFSTPKKETADNSNSNNSSSTQNPTNTPGNVPNNTPNGNFSETAQNGSNSNASTELTTTDKPSADGYEQVPSKEPDDNIEKNLENAINKTLDGCFASASLSAIITVSSIMGITLIKKKKYD